MTTQRELLDRMAKELRDARDDVAECVSHNEAYNLPNAAKYCRGQLTRIDALLAEYAALPSEGNRERSERTAEGVRVDLPVTRDELVRIRNSACGVDYVRISSRMLDTLCTYAIESRYDSPPASASMSAGVTDAMVEAACEAYYTVYLTKGGKEDAMRCALNAAERARANTRAGVKIVHGVNCDCKHKLECEDKEEAEKHGTVRGIPIRTAGDAKGEK